MRREEMSSVVLHLFSLIIIFFLFFHIDISEARSRRIQSCSPSSCGEIQNISYPFHLKGDPYYCHGDIELSCENNKTIIDFPSGRYYVQWISNNFLDWATFQLVEVNLQSSNCSIPYRSMISNDISESQNLRLFDSHVVYYVNCSKAINNPLYKRIPCLSGNTSHVYSLYASELEVSCGIVSIVPILSKFTSQYDTSFPTLQNVFQEGFQMEWMSTAGGYVDYSDIAGFCDSLLHNNYWNLNTGFCEVILNTGVTGICDLFISRYNASFPQCERVLQLSETIGVVLYITLKIIQRFILAAIILVLIVYNLQKKLRKFDIVEKFLCNQHILMPKRYSYTDVIGMSSHSSEKLGQGGFGSVYKGKIPGFSMAIKLLGNSKCDGEDFINEVATIGRIHHVNVVKLIGFCSEGSKRALVYEYMPNGSLDKYIFSKEARHHILSWDRLHDIAFGTAKGIEYLHQGCDMCILHFDIKPHNILLDHNFTPKILDFGLSKLYPKEYDFVSISTTRGTIGYIALELISRNFGVVSDKSDVYSFGMLLLEMVGGRKNVDVKMDNLSEIYFPSWVYDQLNQGRELDIENVTEIEMKIAKKLCIVGLWCIQMKPMDRPSMSKVIQMLENNLDNLQMPPKPVLSSPRQISMRGTHSNSNSTELVNIESQ